MTTQAKQTKEVTASYLNDLREQFRQDMLEIAEAKELPVPQMPAPSAVGASLEDYKARVEEKPKGTGRTRILSPEETMEGLRNVIRQQAKRLREMKDSAAPAVALAVSLEREECAKIAEKDTRCETCKVTFEEFAYHTCERPGRDSLKGIDIASAIRARNDAPQAEQYFDSIKVYSEKEPTPFASRTLPHLRSIAGTETMDLPVTVYSRGSASEALHLERQAMKDAGRGVYVDDWFYGVDNIAGFYRVQREDELIEDHTFAAPVTAYIAEHGWKWEEVRVENAPWINAVNFNHNGDSLHYSLEHNTWSLSEDGVLQGNFPVE